MDHNVIDPTNSNQSEPGNNGNKELLHTPQS